MRVLVSVSVSAGSAHTTVAVSQEDFAHCKDEMDVIVAHCGFRLWTNSGLEMFGKFLWKTESLEEPVKGHLPCMPGFSQTISV